MSGQENNGHELIATYEVKLWPGESLYTVKEETVGEPGQNRVGWIRTLAAITSIVRASELLEHPNHGAVRLCDLESKPDRAWKWLFSIDGNPGLVMRISIYLDRELGIPNSSLQIVLNESLREDLAGITALEPFVVLRDWLCEIPGSAPPRAPRAGYRLVEELIDLNEIDLTKELHPQMLPLIGMLLLENNGLVWPYTSISNDVIVKAFNDSLKSSGVVETIELFGEFKGWSG